MFRSKLIRDTFLLTLMQLFLDSAALLLNSFITRRLGASAIGIFSLMGSFLGLAGILSNGNAFLCTSRLISEEMGKKCGDPNGVLRHGICLCLMLSITVSAVVFGFADIIGDRFFGGGEVTAALHLMPFALISGALSSCLKGYFNACRKASFAAAGDILEFAVRASVIVGMTLMTGTHTQSAVCRIMISSIIAGNVSSLLYMGILYALKHEKSCGKCSLTFRDYAGFAFPIMGGGILTAVMSSTNDALVPVCLRQFGDSHEQALALFGIFEAIVIPTLFFPSVVLCSLSGIIVTESARASAAKNRERVQSITSRIIRYTLIYAVFAAAFLMRFGRQIGELLGGGEQGGSMICAIAPVIPFIYMEIVLEALIKGMGLQGFSSLNYFCEYVIRISAVLILVPRIGFTGIAVSYYASNVFGNISRLVKILRHTGVRFAPMKMVCKPIIYAALTMGAAELICRAAAICDEKTVGMVILGIVWALLYGAIFIISAEHSPLFDKKHLLFVKNAQ